jgi:micrococcal nuclease
MHFLETLQNKTKISKSLLKVLIGVLTIFLFVGLFYPFFTVSKNVEVVKITDGDTVDVRFEGDTETIRLKGVDTPETEGYNTPEEYKGVSSQNWKCLEKWGYKAKDYVKQKIEGEEVNLRYRKGILVVERGAFDRLIGKIYVKDSNNSLNRLLVEEGYARSYGNYYQDLEGIARLNSKGVWECAD